MTRVYAGKAGGSYARHQGGAANIICMPNDPEYSLPYASGVQGNSYVFGIEYDQTVPQGRAHHDAPCAVCNVPTKSTVIMIPAKVTCPGGWTREYFGYLMSEHKNHRRSSYVCVDNHMEVVPGSGKHQSSGHWYHVEARCGTIACPPYNSYKELNCAVCSK